MNSLLHLTGRRSMGKEMHRIRKSYKSMNDTVPPLLFRFTLLSVFVLFVLAIWVFSVPVKRTPYQISRQLSESIAADYAKRSDGKDEPKERVEVLSWEPRAFLYHNFLAKDECEYLINIAKPHMVKSMVVDSKTGGSMDSNVRTSSGWFLNRGQDKIIRRIEKRIADFSHIPVEHGEGLHVLHYEVEQKYDAHYDYFSDTINVKNGGQRGATMLMYLSDVEKGGETVFPQSKVNSSSVPWWDELSECGRSGLSVRPKMGDALLFWSVKPDASLDPSSLHGSCPVIQGNKWSATKWMRLNKYSV
ncbi:probable prolyl 4-hydroxylase 3 [Cryptomeria japonica]|uniref:procollagen-proline 4-dioxygenase n=1 Tax=Cryptomeria japonica TaxID=3369 RepID=Q1XG55_CRYJA|nr:probable prolyl 4-hydroxylase 3 [Cryptomeria japonica]XP_057866504.1 probable prolyl 4-hydroxylase 3 [Cryptomeria japonica]BAE92293.1 putative prolyl 4-hydroxylase, alpha subunit [Cryptomeria japonica]